MKIGAVTIGQSPRVDVTPDIMPIFGEQVELIQAGALGLAGRKSKEWHRRKTTMFWCRG